MAGPGNALEHLLWSSISTADRARVSTAVRAAHQYGQAQWLVLPRADQLPLSALITPSDGQPRPQIQVRDPHAIDIDPAALQALFGLTPAEATVAGMLAAGWQPAQIAIRLNVQLNTVAAHLKRVLAKTDVGRQAALVALMRGSVACRACP